MTDVRVTPKPWLWKPRTQPIRLIEIHSTRGGSANAMTDYIATCNWMQNVNNGSAAQGWGGSCSRILGPAGEMAIVLEDNQMPTYCAGYGGSGTWAIDEYGKAYEWAQPNRDTPYSDAMYRRGAKEIALDCKAYGIPPRFLEIWDQRGAVPTGLVRHDRCENGVKLGKSDPGNQFDEAKFLGYLNAELQTPQEEDFMAGLSDQQQRDLDTRIHQIWNVLFNDVDPTTADVPRWAYWTALMQAGAAPDPATVATAKAIADELSARLED